MNDPDPNDEKFKNMMALVGVTSAQLAARMALAIYNGVSPNRVMAWVNSTTPSHPDQWADTLAMSKVILDVVLKEIEYLEKFKESMEDK